MRKTARTEEFRGQHINKMVVKDPLLIVQNTDGTLIRSVATIVSLIKTSYRAGVQSKV